MEKASHILPNGIIISSDCEEILIPTILNGEESESHTDDRNSILISKENNLVYYDEQDPGNDTIYEEEGEEEQEHVQDELEQQDYEAFEEMEEEVLDDEDNEVLEQDVEESCEIYRKEIVAQVPKKRKISTFLRSSDYYANSDPEVVSIVETLGDADADEHIDGKETAGSSIIGVIVDNSEDNEDTEDNDLPTSSTRAVAKKDDDVDEQQCRVCTTKVNLISLFKTVDQLTIAEMLMNICPSISIAPKDFMPQFICNQCLDNVHIALQLKSQCETTEKELRKKLSRHKNKIRRPSGYVVVDAPVESEPPTDDNEAADDVEFKISENDSFTFDDDSDDSDFSTSKKRGRKSNRGRRKVGLLSSAKKKPGRPPNKSINAEQNVFDMNSSDEEADYAFNKKKRIETSGTEKYPCDQCDQVFNRNISLVLHKRAHNNVRPLIKCEYCGKEFKIQGAYRTHVKNHKLQNDFPCSFCGKHFTTKVELRRHLANNHNSEILHQCNSCRRSFVSEVSLQKHQNSNCRGINDSKHRRNDCDTYTVGKDLFKSVAPLTTTYWSDSFSD